jgi:hypothetical protein
MGSSSAWSRFNVTHGQGRPLRPRFLALLLTALGTSAGLGGCGSGSNDYAVVVSYVVNGLAPTPEECAAQGIKSVRLTVESGSRRRSVENACGETSIFLSDGYEYGGFLTTDWFEYGALYRYNLDMLGVNGDVLIPGSGTFTAYYDDITPVELPTLDFFAPRTPGGEIATVTGSFTVGSGPDLTQACAAAGINRVELWVYSVLDELGEYYDRALYAPCDTGVLDSGTPLLNPGDYWVSYVAMNYVSETNYTVIEESDPISVQVLEPGTVALEPHAFAGP